MRLQIGDHQRDAFRITHQRLQRGPHGFEVDAVAAPRLLHPAGCASVRLSRSIPCRSASFFVSSSPSVISSNSAASFGSSLALRPSLAMRLS